MEDLNIQSVDAIAIQLEAMDRLALPASGISMGRGWTNAVELRVVSRSRRAPSCGDVILYRVAGNLIAHRAIRQVRKNDTWWWITKGDGAWAPDQIPIADADVLGVVEAVSINGTWRMVMSTSGRLSASFHVLIGRLGLLIWPPIWK